MKTCPDCGERVYSLGCTNCNEVAYINEQERLTALIGDGDYDDVELTCGGCMGPCGRCHEPRQAVDAVDPHV
jgi:hypothetical protein